MADALHADRLFRPPPLAGELDVSVPFAGRFPRESVADAIPIYEGIVALVARTAGADSAAVGRGHHFLAGLYRAVGEHDAAEQAYRKALEILEKQPDLLDAAGAANNLGLFHLSVGEPAKAEPLFRRALDLWSQVEAGDRSFAAVAEQNLAAVHLDLGELQQADEWIRKALASLELAREPDPGQVAILHQNRALVQQFLGRLQEAEREYRRVLAGDAFPAWARAGTLNNLAEVLRHRGDYQEAETLLRRAAEGFPEGSSGRALVLANLGALFYDAGDADRAVGFLAEALEVRRRIHGPKSPEVGRCLVSLGLAEHARGRLEEARALLERGVAIWSASRPSGHPELAGALESQALLESEAGRPERALLTAQEAYFMKERQLHEVLSFGTEAERLAFREASAPYDLLANLAVRPSEVRALATAVMRSKGVVLESSLEERRRAGRAQAPPVREALLDLYELRKRWVRASLAPGAGDDGNPPAEIIELERQVTEAEKTLADRLGRPEAPLGVPTVDVDDIQDALEVDQVLVEMVRYEHHVGRGRLEPHYGALVLGRRGHPSWVPLGPAERIDGLVEELSSRMRCGARGAQRLEPAAAGCGDDASLADLLRRLYRAVWQAVEERLPTPTRRVIVAPDAKLYFLPLGVLLGPDDRFIVERYGLIYAASGRDLLRGGALRPERTMAIYAAPAYGASGPRARSGPARLEPLPFTAEEARTLVDLGTEHGWRVTLATGTRAREGALRKLQPAPGILHLATHGFVLSRDADDDEALLPLARQPMLASFLALADAQATLDAWRRSDVPPPVDDGILTAAEVSDLPLDGTWLVVLSACDTGLGDARAGEGVFGLRRGFTLAGASFLLTTLWSVEDAASADFMADFYGELFSHGKNPAEALRQVQRQRLLRLRRAEGLATAVWKTGGFVVSSG